MILGSWEAGGLCVFPDPGWSGGLLSWQWPQGSALSKFHVSVRGGRACPCPRGPAPDGQADRGPGIPFSCVWGAVPWFEWQVSFSITDLERSCWADRPHSPHRSWTGWGPLESGGGHVANSHSLDSPRLTSPWSYLSYLPNLSYIHQISLTAPPSLPPSNPVIAHPPAPSAPALPAPPQSVPGHTAGGDSRSANGHLARLWGGR